MNLGKLAKYILTLYLGYSVLSGFFSYFAVNDISVKEIQKKIIEDPKFFSLIHIDEPNKCTYFFRNVSPTIRSFLFDSTFRVYQSQTTNFETIIHNMYNSTSDVPNIYYLQTSIFSQIMSYVIVIGSILTLLNIFVTTALEHFTEKMQEGMADKKKEGRFEIIKNSKIRFKDIVGMHDVKKDMQEYIDIMNNRNKFLSSGVKIPRGLLFMGPPGVGKTYFAKAIAGECKATFISVCASDFIEVFVGTGSKRVRELFKKAREQTPCIIFIDELDSLGSRDSIDRNNEYSSTINSLLTEMDGFKDSENILVIGSTNNYKSLDKALMRSGRLDRKIVFDPPNIEERKELLKFYLNQKKLIKELKDSFEEQVTLLAKKTAGLTPADINNIINQATLIYVKRTLNGNKQKIEEKKDSETSDDSDSELESKEDKKQAKKHKIDLKKLKKIAIMNKKSIFDDGPDGVSVKDIDTAMEEVMIGQEKRERTTTKEELKMIAYHEAGHSLMGILIKEMNPPIRTSIVPRGVGILGYSQPEPDDKKINTREYLVAELCVLLGGRGAEQVVFDTMTSGASNDLEKATSITNNYLTSFGMSKNFGLVNTSALNNNRYVNENNKDKLAAIKKILELVSTFVNATLTENREELNKIAERLLEKEVIEKQETLDLVAKEKIQSINMKKLVEDIDKI
jgi:ATP-dependent Zn protease